MVYSQWPSTALTSNFEVASRIQAIIQRAIQIYPDLGNDPQLEQGLSAIQELQAKGIKAALSEVVRQIPEASDTALPEPDDVYVDMLRDLEGLEQASFQEFSKKIPMLLGYLKQLWSASATEGKLVLMQHISQMIHIADDETIKNLAGEMLSQPDPRLKGEMCYALGLSGRSRYLPLVRPFLEDRDPWVRKQASGAVKRLEALDEATAQVLDDLLDFIEKTRERFYNEHRRYQVLARIRKILRERLFERFPVDSTDRNLVTTVINATNRTTAKNFRIKYLDIFKDSLAALREGRTDAKTIELLEKRLLEIDDEL